MKIQLTLYDEQSLRSFLYQQLTQGKTPVAVIRSALETPIDELIPWLDLASLEEEVIYEPHPVHDVNKAVCG